MRFDEIFAHFHMKEVITVSLRAIVGCKNNPALQKDSEPETSTRCLRQLFASHACTLCVHKNSQVAQPNTQHLGNLPVAQQGKSDQSRADI
jgi:hypothetical protein